MSDEGIFATTAEVSRKVGTGASTTSNVEAYINHFIGEAESYINLLTGVNYSDSYSSLNVDKRDILKEAASCLAANNVILWNVKGYANQREQENLVNYNWQRFIQCIKLLTANGKTTFLSAT